MDASVRNCSATSAAAARAGIGRMCRRAELRRACNRRNGRKDEAESDTLLVVTPLGGIYRRSDSDSPSSATDLEDAR
jgi:hypothetical protein